MRLLPQLTRFDQQVFSVERGIVRRHRIRERLADGAVYRTFWFEDRDDADRFLWAAITGSLRYEHDLWKLPTPYWEPSPWADVSYDFITYIRIATNGGGNWPVPSDFNPGSNFIDAVGAGGSGGQASASAGGASGGAGGGWGRKNNAPLVPGGVAAYFTNAGPVGPISTGTAAGSAGADSWMRSDGGTTNPGSAAQGCRGAGGGGGGVIVAGTAPGGVPTGPCIGDLTNVGGGGGVARCTAGASAGGGGGAGGPGGIGSTPGSPLNSWSAGGASPGGGAGGATEGANGSPGTNIGDGSDGSGGGGAGRMTTAGTGGTGARAGGGGGGSAWSAAGINTRGGSAGLGMVWVTYTPAVSMSFNIPMMGF